MLVIIISNPRPCVNAGFLNFVNKTLLKPFFPRRPAECERDRTEGDATFPSESLFLEISWAEGVSRRHGDRQ